MSRHAIKPSNLRLVGTAALLIAAKFEEIYPPEIRDLVYMADHQFSIEELKEMEVLILAVLEFSVAGQTAAHFMDRFQRANHCTELQGRLVQYILELALCQSVWVRHPAHHLAASAVLVANRLA